MKDWFTFIILEYEYEYTHCNSLHAKRICTRGPYEDCPKEAYVYLNYGHHYLGVYVPGERDERKWL